MKRMNYSRQQKTAEGAARKAGKILEELYEKETLKVSSKKVGETDSTVTEADLAAEKAIIDTLSKKFPDYSILSEEAGETRKDSEYRWIIDPLDGTRNFSCNNPDFCTMIALQYRNDIVCSAVFVPYTKDMYAAQKGKGARLNSRKINVSKRGNIERFLVSFCGLKKLDKEKLNGIVKAFGSNLRVTGCAGSSGGFVAAGRQDAAMWPGLQIQDMAPAYLLVKEAGGIATDMKGAPWTPNSKSFLASNGRLHEKLLEIIGNK